MKKKRFKNEFLVSEGGGFRKELACLSTWNNDRLPSVTIDMTKLSKSDVKRLISWLQQALIEIEP